MINWLKSLHFFKIVFKLCFQLQVITTKFFRCDADPQALSKYIVALVKKDRNEDELKAVCENQLEVFLRKGLPKSFFFC